MNAAFTPDGTGIVTYDGALNKWDASTAQRLHSAGPLGLLGGIRFNAERTLGLTITSKEGAQVWNVRTGQSLGAPMPHAGSILDAAWSPDGRWVLTGSSDKSAQVWDGRTGRPIGRRLEHPDRVLSVDFSADGTRMLTASERTVRVWNRTTGASELALEHPQPVRFAVFSPDGRRIATVAGAGRLWDATTGRLIGTPMKQAAMDDAVFSHDGHRLATRSGFRNVQLWDGTTAQPLGPPLQHADTVLSVAFSFDGTRVATGSRDSTARVWDVRTGQPISAPLLHFVPVVEVNFNPDGTQLVTASGGMARLWRLPVTMTQDAGLIADVAEAVSGYRVSETGSLSPIEDAAAHLQALRAGAAIRGPGRAANLLRWVFEDPWQRRISPFSPITADDYVSRLLSACVPVATREVAWHFPGHPLLRTLPTKCVASGPRDTAPAR
jgi:WD40 repeat protein